MSLHDLKFSSFESTKIDKKGDANVKKALVDGPEKVVRRYFLLATLQEVARLPYDDPQAVKRGSEVVMWPQVTEWSDGLLQSYENAKPRLMKVRAKRAVKMLARARGKTFEPGDSLYGVPIVSTQLTVFQCYPDATNTVVYQKLRFGRVMLS
jgi:hypothetical protein